MYFYKLTLYLDLINKIILKINDFKLFYKSFIIYLFIRV